MNRFPYSTFEWEGIDGTSVIAHFPPADSYSSSASPEQLLKSCENHKSKYSSNRSLLLFGHGDGGGGPAVSHLEYLQRELHCLGLPKLSLNNSVEDFFEAVEADHKKCSEVGMFPPRWVGELYLELHQGTLTSQANIKKQNRLCEALLRGCDAMFALVHVANMTHYSQQDRETLGRDKTDLNSLKKEITQLWKDLLLNQFHDVIRMFPI